MMLRNRLDQLLVVDVEATCWEGVSPLSEKSEIIEIGLCLLDLKTLQRSEKTSLLVRPEFSTVSAFCTQLTTLTPEQVAQGMTFAEACQILQSRYGSIDRVWGSYSDYDRKMFERQCALRNVPYPFGSTHLNIKTLCALHLKLDREIGLAAALKRLRIPLEGTHHRGDDDAWNTAQLLALLFGALRTPSEQSLASQQGTLFPNKPSTYT